ncbi:MAG: 9-O-acetylesterase [Bacteroidales bacterium]|nr:9-O-acetylesterase [Bacteroidales bacterium]
MKKVFIALVLIFLSLPGKSDVRLPAIFTDNMVLQRDMPLKIWGWADKNEKVTVRFNGQVQSTGAGKEGTWSIQFESMSVSNKPLTLVVKGKNSITLENILIGDVWICSGQSNMQWTLRQLEVGASESRAADYPDMRMFTVTREMALARQDDLNGSGWKVTSGEHVIDFSAVAYYFGKNLVKATEIPIGLISTSWGGTNSEAWTSMEILQKYNHIDAVFNKLDKTIDYSLTAQDKRRENRIGLMKKEVNNCIGIQEDWQVPGRKGQDWDWITLPQVGENGLFDNMDGTAWFRKSFDLPSPFQNKDIQFNLGPLKDHGIVWVNGHQIGESFEPDRWRNYRAKAEILKPHGNEIVVRLFDYGDDGGFPSDPFIMNFHPVDDPKVPQLLSGDWKYKISQRLKEPIVFPADGVQYAHVNQAPSSLFNQMIHPLLNLSITGAIWYQGESNAGRAHEYASLFPDMIRDWRMHWGQGDFPFYFVQLAGYDRPATQTWPELREAQKMALELPNTGMAVTTDIGHPTNIHPENKWDVGKRLALPALRMVYGKDITWSGPVLEDVEQVDGKIKLTFSQVGDGLRVKSDHGYLMGFEVSEDGANFEYAQAMIKDEHTIHLWSQQVKKPQFVRYAWLNYPVNANLFNSDGLPASPFRTGTWEWITKGNTYGD